MGWAFPTADYYEGSVPDQPLAAGWPTPARERLTGFPGSPGECHHTALGSACTPGSALCLARDRGPQGVSGVLMSYPYEMTLACPRQVFRSLHPWPTSAGGPSYGASSGSFSRNPSRILASRSRGGRPPFSHIVERASDTRLPRVRVPASLATLFTPNRVPRRDLSLRALPGAPDRLMCSQPSGDRYCSSLSSISLPS
jgi:hypothetical protein